MSTPDSLDAPERCGHCTSWREVELGIWMCRRMEANMCPTLNALCRAEFNGSSIICAMPAGHEGVHCNVTQRRSSGAILPGAVAWMDETEATK